MCGVFNKVRRSETDHLNTLEEVRGTVHVSTLELNFELFQRLQQSSSNCSVWWSEACQRVLKCL